MESLENKIEEGILPALAIRVSKLEGKGNSIEDRIHRLTQRMMTLEKKVENLEYMYERIK